MKQLTEKNVLWPILISNRNTSNVGKYFKITFLSTSDASIVFYERRSFIRLASGLRHHLLKQFAFTYLTDSVLIEPVTTIVTAMMICILVHIFLGEETTFESDRYKGNDQVERRKRTRPGQTKKLLAILKSS